MKEGADGRICTPEQIEDATGHISETFERHFQNRQGRALEVMLTIKRLGLLNLY